MKKTVYFVICIIGVVLLFGSLGAVDIGIISITGGIWQIILAAVLCVIGYNGHKLEINREMNVIHKEQYVIKEKS